ncbi:hypothetical protein DE146DRAFT_676133 [Phaeosphaeria sp. MPI-PUGE-AT-0046c]|nr:hypothetical protein DE146DRAFT_676133 [Phaeosphaeria sp. MPI-PUGE-AT-0046c]
MDKVTSKSTEMECDMSSQPARIELQPILEAQRTYAPRYIWQRAQASRHERGHNEWATLTPFEFGLRYVPVKDEKACADAEFHDKAAQWKSQWDNSDLHRKLIAFLKTHTGSVTRIDQIICFGLGNTVSSTHPRVQRISYVQHLAAHTVRDTLASQQGGAAPTMFAQDPEYKAVDTSYLSEHFDCTVLDDPEGFKALDGNTFVIAFAPNVPVRQIALDMTHDSNGPAGFLCDAIKSDGLEGEGLTRKECYEAENNVYYTCNPSPGLWKYKEQGLWMEHDDRDELGCFRKVGVYLKKCSEGE